MNRPLPRPGRYGLTAEDIRSVDPDRFWAKVQKGDGCWEWTGALGRSGYGSTTIPARRSNTGSHRVAWVLSGHDLDPSLEIDHLCSNPPCVNPAHLDMVTQRENNRRSRSFTAQNARKTHCPQDHPYSSENTYFSPDGSRRCLTCRRDTDRERKRRQRSDEGVRAAKRESDRQRSLRKRTCEVCGHEMSPTNLPRHMRNNHAEVLA